MNLIEVCDRLKTLKIPIAYKAFKSKVTPPYAVYYEDGAVLHGSDERNYIKDMNVTIEFYSEVKGLENEAAIEKLFNDVELIKSTDTWLDDEQLYMIVYNFTTTNKIGE